MTFTMPDAWYEPADEVDPDDGFIDERDDDRAYDAWCDDVISGHADDDPNPYLGT